MLDSSPRVMTSCFGKLELNCKSLKWCVLLQSCICKPKEEIMGSSIHGNPVHLLFFYFWVCLLTHDYSMCQHKPNHPSGETFDCNEVIVQIEETQFFFPLWCFHHLPDFKVSHELEVPWHQPSQVSKYLGHHQLLLLYSCLKQKI